MFITKNQYKWLLYRLSEAEKAIEEHDGELFSLSGKINRLPEIPAELTERLTALEDEAESLAEERKREQDFFTGLNNIMNYEVPNGRNKAE